MSTIKKTILFEKEAVIEGSNYKNYENKFIILAPNSLNETWREAKWQLFYATGGFGTDPSKLGNAIFGIYVGDGEEARVERYNVLGIASDEAIEEWKQIYGDFCKETKDYIEK